MSFQVNTTADRLVVSLRGFDRLLCWRRAVSLPFAAITAVRRVDRAEVEATLDHRLFGVGSHRGDRHQGRRRVGAFMGRETAAGCQFWAVGQGQRTVLAIQSDNAQWQRLVLDPTRCSGDVLQLVGGFGIGD